jgi:hypothetical protein
MKSFLFVVFTAFYFWLFCQVIDFLFRNSGVNFVTDVLAVVCWIIAFVASVGLGDFTVKKVEESFRK